MDIYYFPIILLNEYFSWNVPYLFSFLLFFLSNKINTRINPYTGIIHTKYHHGFQLISFNLRTCKDAVKIRLHITRNKQKMMKIRGVETSIIIIKNLIPKDIKYPYPYSFLFNLPLNKFFIIINIIY